MQAERLALRVKIGREALPQGGVKLRPNGSVKLRLRAGRQQRRNLVGRRALGRAVVVLRIGVWLDNVGEGQPHRACAPIAVWHFLEGVLRNRALHPIIRHARVFHHGMVLLYRVVALFKKRDRRRRGQGNHVPPPLLHGIGNVACVSYRRLIRKRRVACYNAFFALIRPFAQKTRRLRVAAHKREYRLAGHLFLIQQFNLLFHIRQDNPAEKSLCAVDSRPTIGIRHKRKVPA